MAAQRRGNKATRTVEGIRAFASLSLRSGSGVSVEPADGNAGNDVAAVETA